ncbi:hypothetical protein SBOR_5119 [Sclerotinia borealis F-4128]|uniref:Peptidase A1 domain-containing protein n=1 Tax=Sclerotinia borealis (strain F-4128) TaxID=1432307 RepID=W9CF30_SCLBF|nr:hypothetical protein SBOR_5119 [Sclerotinia borealis F-4128]
MASLLFHTIIFLLLTLTFAQVRIPITRKTHLSHPALNRHLSSRASVSVSLVNNITQASYVISVKIGTPPQDIDLIIDTGSSDTWLIAATAESCTASELQEYNWTDESTCNTPYYPNASSSINLDVTNDTFNIQYLDGSESQGSYIADTFHLGDVTVHSLQMGLAYITDIQTGIFGVGYTVGVASDAVYPNIIEDLISQNLISTRAYSLYLDSYDSPTGSILFGAIDTSKFTGNLVAMDIIPAPFWNGSLLYSSFDIELVGLGITDQEGSTTNFATSPEVVTLDSGTTITYLPPALTNTIYKYFNAYDDTMSTSNVYIPCSLLTTSSSLTINYLFSSSFVSATIKVPLSELIFPLTNPIYALTPGSTLPALPFSGEACGFGVQPGSEGSYLLGDTFLRSAYVVYDLENNEIGLAQANFDASNTSSSSSGGDESIVELKAGETGVPLLGGDDGSSSSSTSLLEPMSTATGGSKNSGTGIQTATATGTAIATQTGKSGGSVPMARSLDPRTLGFIVLVGLIAGGAMVMI